MPFDQIIEFNYTTVQTVTAESAQREAFITDAVASLTDYVAAIGDARTNGGWCFS